MRKIFFRGKRRDNGEWYYGSYLFLHVPDYDWTGIRRGPAKDVHFIIDEKDINYAVDPETLGQYTGLTDKNGEKIFEGDIVEHTAFGYGNIRVGSIEYVDKYGAFFIKGSGYSDNQMYAFSNFKVIGNIYDNPELLSPSIE